MGFLDAATNAIDAGKNALDNVGSATGLSSVTSAISGAVSSVTSMLKGGTPTIKVPLPNSLFSYASYDYVLGIGVLSRNEINYPDSTYMAGKKIQLICKSANADPTNRVQTKYGAFDFYIDNVEINSLISASKGQNTNTTTFSFDITEPYSMGMFMISCEQAARTAGWPNWHQAPFILTIDFRGTTESGSMNVVPGLSRKIPFKFGVITSKINGNGTVYSCTAMAYNGTALTSKIANLKTDTSISGTTVQEMLQTGKKSLQAVINKKLKELETSKTVGTADQIAIIFPAKIESAPQPSTANTESKSTATTAAPTTTTADKLYKKLGVFTSETNSTLVQNTEDCNKLGKADMNFGIFKKADAPMAKDNDIYSQEKGGIFVRGNMAIDPKMGDFRFRQDTSIPNAINQVLIQSTFPEKALDADALSPEGYRDWWRIDTQVYEIESSSNIGNTNVSPRLIVYRVVPYYVHASTGPVLPEVQIQGLQLLGKHIVKQYDYIYTGKNADVINFEMELSASFQQIMAADGMANTMDSKRNANAAISKKPEEIKGLDTKKGQTAPKPKAATGAPPASISNSGTNTADEKKGGGNVETPVTRAARMFQDILTKGIDQQVLNLEIIGDPYWIAQSGQANYTSASTPIKNLNKDGTVNWQNGEVHIVVNFRTPIDLNQTTGLMNGISKSAPVTAYSGVYRITTLINHFKQGKFTQNITGLRIRGQDAGPPASKQDVLNVSTPATPPTSAGGDRGTRGGA